MLIYKMIRILRTLFCEGWLILYDIFEIREINRLNYAFKINIKTSKVLEINGLIKI